MSSVNRGLVSIVIPFHNAEKYIENCLNCVKEQIYKSSLDSACYYFLTPIATGILIPFKNISPMRFVQIQIITAKIKNLFAK